jgi:hypothetical protein
MVDVRLLYPKEKLEAAARLAESVEAAGYSVERQALDDNGAFPALPAPGAGAGAEVLLLIWSRGLVTAAMNGGLAEARRHPRLIEVSVDGIEPGVGGEVSPVVLLSGWRGQPFHLGWQRILADIKRLSGPREAPTKARATVPANSAEGSPPGPPGRSGARRTGVRAGVAAAALLAATLGAAAALDWGRPEGRDPAAAIAVASAPVPAAEMPPTPVPAGASVSDASTAPVAPLAEGRTAARDSAPDVLPAPAAAGRSAPARKSASAAGEPRRKAAAASAGASRAARAYQPAVKRYSRKYSKTMRLFCQRSGRSTPQCRTFIRSMRDQRG